MSYRKYIVNETFFEKINTPEKAYWLGFLYADGHNTEGKLWRVTLALQNRDTNHVIKFRDIMYPNKDRNIYHRPNDMAAAITITSKKISQDLIKLGLVNRKSLIIDFPTENIVPKYLQLYFIQGVFDGDGSISLTKHTKTPCACLDFCGSFKLISKLKNIIYNLTGITFGFKQRKNIYVTYIKGNDIVLKFLNWLYADSIFILERKYNKYLEVQQIKNGIIQKKSSRFHGVYLKRGHPYGRIESGGIIYHLGRFQTEIDAAKAYNKKAIKLFGGNAKLNIF